jgi:hypothetical protein
VLVHPRAFEEDPLLKDRNTLLYIYRAPAKTELKVVTNKQLTVTNDFALFSNFKLKTSGCIIHLDACNFMEHAHLSYAHIIP